MLLFNDKMFSFLFLRALRLIKNPRNLGKFANYIPKFIDKVILSFVNYILHVSRLALFALLFSIVQLGDQVLNFLMNL